MNTSSYSPIVSGNLLQLESGICFKNKNDKKINTMQAMVELYTCLECIKMGTTKPRCIKFRHGLRCIYVWSFLLLKQSPLSNGNKYPMLCGYRMRCSWIKAK